MNIREFVQRIRSGFRPDAELSDSLIQELIRSLENTQEQECSCDDVYALLDEYAEKELRKADAARLMPLLRQHMDICHECCEEYEALLKILEATVSR